MGIYTIKKIIKVFSLPVPLLFCMALSQARASTDIGVFTAYTYINDLGISLQDGQSSRISRAGIKLGADANWADIDYQGGPSASVFFNQDKDLADSRNISDLGLMFNYLQPLSSRWLLRSSLMLEQYRNEVVLSTGFDGMGLDMTAGYMGDQQQGLDISIKLLHENHQQDISDSYQTDRRQLALAYYFPRQKNQPFWTARLQWQDNLANDDLRDYQSSLIGLAYKGWRLAELWGNIIIQQRQDNYRLAEPVRREDKLNFISADLSMLLYQHWLLRASLSAGVYQSSLLTESQDYLQMSLGVQRRF